MRIRRPSGNYKTKPKPIKTMRRELGELTFNAQLLYVGNLRRAWLLLKQRAKYNPDDQTIKHDMEVAEINFRNAFKEVTGYEPPMTMTDE